VLPDRAGHGLKYAQARIFRQLKKPNNFRLTLLKKHLILLILLRSLKEAFSENSMNFFDCRAFSHSVNENRDGVDVKVGRKSCVV